VLYQSFSTNITVFQPSLFVTPSVLPITTAPEKTIERTITVQNTAPIDANIITSFSGLSLSVDGPSVIGAGESVTLTLRLNTFSLSEGVYDGQVNFNSVVGDASVIINLNVIGDVTSQAYQKISELDLLESNITYLSKMWVNTSDAEKLLNEAKTLFNEVIAEYENENYLSAKAKFDKASAKFSELQTTLSQLYVKSPDYSFLIWYFAAAVVVIIITITIIKLRGRRKKPKIEKREVIQPKKKEVYFEPKGGEYRTEYY